MGVFVVAVVSLVAMAGLARADLTAKVFNKFKGKVLITEQPLNLLELGDTKQTITSCNKRQLTKVKHVLVDGTPTWSFHYTAFLKAKPRVGTLKFEFYFDVPGEGLELRADKTMVGVDRSLKTLQGRIDISEDDNVSAGKTYTVKLIDEVRNTSKTYATTKITFK